MFFLNFSSVWSLSFFFTLTYIIIFFSFLIYLLPLSLSLTNLLSKTQIKNNFYMISGLETSLFFSLPLLCVLLNNIIWSSNDITAWFGHVIFSSFQSKLIILLSIFFMIVFYIFLTVSYFSSTEIYDFLITKYNFLYWIIFLFLANSIFTVIFVIEVLSTLIFLLITTSTFSSSFFFKNINFDLKFFFHNSKPYLFLQSLLYFFWVSLISSLNLFLFIIILYNNLVTFDWYLIEYIFFYLTLVSSLKDLLVIGITWLIIIFSIFLKCGIAPLFLWKPTFFKGISLSTLFFYITFFYFFLFLFFINFFLIYFHELFYYYTTITLVFITLGLLNLFLILCESFFLKTFFAVSSILNSLLVILSMTAPHLTDIVLYL